MKELRNKFKKLLSELDYGVNEGVIFSNKDLIDFELILDSLKRQILTIKTFNTNKGYNPLPILKKISMEQANLN